MAEDNSEKENAERGRQAERPREITKLGWKDILKRVFGAMSQENASVMAAGIAFYAFTSIPALLTAVVTVYGMVANPAQVQAQMSSLRGVIPPQALGLLSSQLEHISAHGGGSLTIALVISLVFAFYTASNGVRALIDSLNAMYEEQEKRGLLKLTGLSLAFTVGASLLAIFSIALVVGITAGIGSFNLTGVVKTAISVARWPLLATLVMFGFALLYRFAPCRTYPKWKWVSWGSAAATAIWLSASALFSWYTGSFGSYDKTYGSLGAVVVLLMWFYITGYAILIGGKLNAEMEHQTDRDSTVGEPMPMGKRGAKMADTRGKAA